MTRYYALSSYGIVLNGLFDPDFLRTLADDGDIEAYSSFTGEAFPLRDDGSEMWSDGESLVDETLYFVPLPRMPRLFGAAYGDMDELVRVADEAYRNTDTLPDPGPVRGRIRKIVGTYYG